MSEIFGEKLRAQRLKRGHTLESLAEEVGSTKAYIWQLENKRPARPSADLLLKIARVLDVSPDFLIDDQATEDSQRQLVDALARRIKGKNLSQSDIQRLFKIAEMMQGDEADKRGK